ncbi:DUF2971 domain-containing protein [Ferrovibrio sp.]|uniref:DUF2971 domain-containing protein n=1 Tax=Ferrovibrio sp. TaxID=1917215 RepID=UPI000CAD0321|nr:DUF2971 domain-containing protein [Ferrovibrio sp.]PJI37712.1 MAG: hypothetical protein CTR53_18940 [Ferrovibrio sp.]
MIYQAGSLLALFESACNPRGVFVREWGKKGMEPSTETNPTTLTTYKYLSAAGALRNLREGSVYLAHRDQLNDTLEARFDLVDSEAFLDVALKTVNEVARMRRERRWSLRATSTQEFAEVTRKEDENFRSFCENIGICSLAQRPDHQAMWAYYSDWGRGVCFELEWTHELMEMHQLWLHPVHYTNAPRILNRAEDWRAEFLQLPVRYPEKSLEELLDYILEKDFRRRYGIRSAARSVSIKHTDWQHEQELRLLGPHSRVALPVLRATLRRVHYLQLSEEVAEVFRYLFQNYPKMDVVWHKFEHGQLSDGQLSNSQIMELKAVPL